MNFRAQKSSPLYPILSYINSVYIITPHFRKAYSIIFLHSHSFAKCLFYPFRFSDKNMEWSSNVNDNFRLILILLFDSLKRTVESTDTKK
jgi:hypothetical protein